MNTFVVSSRKYRPSRFAEVKGQEHVITTLQNAVRNDQVASALLFCGPRGSGKTTSARLLAKTLNCDQPTLHGEPCNDCTYCQQFQKQTSLNVHELDAASHNSAEDMRQIVEQTRYHPPKGKKNIIMIDEAHMLSNAALNVLLKPLEDTPAHVVFMLITTEKQKIIPTVLSRCQVFEFHRIQEKDIIDQLRYVAEKENISFEPAALELISQNSEGSLRDALSTFDLIATYQDDGKVTYDAVLYHLHLLDDQFYFDITEAVHKGDMSTILTMYDKIIREGFNGQDFITGWSQYLRNLLLLKTAPDSSSLNIPDHLQSIYRDKATAMSTPFLYQLLAIAQEGDIHYKNTLSQQLFVELMLIKAAQIHNPDPRKKTKSLKIDKAYPQPKEDEFSPTQVAEPSSEYIRAQSQYTSPKSPTSNASLNNHTPVSNTLQATLAPSQSSPKKELPSLKALREKLKTPATPSNQNLESPSTEKEAPYSPPLEEEQIRPHWESYRESLRKKGQYKQVALLSQPIMLNNNTLAIQITNHIQEEHLQEIKKLLTQYLRQNLNHPTLTITTVLTEKKTNAPQPNPQEQIAHSFQAAPSFPYLQDKLGLVPY